MLKFINLFSESSLNRLIKDIPPNILKTLIITYEVIIRILLPKRGPGLTSFRYCKRRPFIILRGKVSFTRKVTKKVPPIGVKWERLEVWKVLRLSSMVLHFFK